VVTEELASTDFDMTALSVQAEEGLRKTSPIQYETTPASVMRRMRQTVFMQKSLEKYKKLESLDMVNVKVAALDMLTHPARMAGASFDELLKLVKLTNDRQQLLDGKPQTTHGALIAHIVKASEMRKEEDLKGAEVAATTDDVDYLEEEEDAERLQE